ncbi:glycosyltransferase family 2 protein [Vibrio gigantis]|uniref:glycosyltransferase family 2 protein n=1 Tax=Vibrio gigantis TaxID=296199 RepID=UPI003D104F67
MSVSVALAVYNGECFLSEQLDSILLQLGEGDEVVISYDKSTDNTLSLLQKYAQNDKRINIFFNDTPGVVGNFSNAIEHCKNEYIFLSDQDDIWLPGKVEKVVSLFSSQSTLAVIHDYKLVDKDLNTLHESGFVLRGGSCSVLKNLVRLSYIGCCMAFRNNAKAAILPIATKERSHDWWIGTVLGMLGEVKLLEEPLILHRMHENNATPKKRPGVKYQLKVRCLILFNAIFRFMKIKLKVT